MVCSLMHCCSSMARLASAMLLLTLYWGCHSWVWTRPTELVGALPPPPIDVVYMWGGEPQWSADNRQRDNGELRYSIRSLWKHCRWVRRVHILVNSDTRPPSWMRELGENPWIDVVDRCTLFTDPAHCPTKNAFAAYTVAHRIPGLSNQFLLLDDDTFISRTVGPDFWFDQRGHPIVRTPHTPEPIYPLGHKLSPNNSAFPLEKWASHHHQVNPLRVDWALDFEATYPRYHEFVQSHSGGRFINNLVEYMPSTQRDPRPP